jgi:pimeloyl-ACP methyl ester carboxylesterase
VALGPANVVSRDGTSIAVGRSGEGPPLVLVHGTAADHNRWGPVLPALEARFAVLAIDCRGRWPFRDLDMPTLFLQDGDSPYAFKAAGEAVRAALADCRIVVMPGQRHAAMDTGTDLFTSEVLSFLDSS